MNSTAAPGLRWKTPAEPGDLEASMVFDEETREDALRLRAQFPEQNLGQALAAKWNDSQRASVSLHDGERLLGCLLFERITPPVLCVIGMLDLGAPGLIDITRQVLSEVFTCSGAMRIQAVGRPEDGRIRLAQQLGGKFEGRFAGQGVYRGLPCDLISVGLFREDFQRAEQQRAS